MKSELRHIHARPSERPSGEFSFREWKALMMVQEAMLSIVDHGFNPRALTDPTWWPEYVGAGK